MVYFWITQYHLRWVQLLCIYPSVFAVAAVVVLRIKLCEMPKYGQLGFILIFALGFSVDQIGVNFSLQKSRPSFSKNHSSVSGVSFEKRNEKVVENYHSVAEQKSVSVCHSLIVYSQLEILTHYSWFSPVVGHCSLHYSIDLHHIKGLAARTSRPRVYIHEISPRIGIRK